MKLNRYAAIAMAATLSLGLAACSSDEDDAKDAAASATSVAADAAESATSVAESAASEASSKASSASSEAEESESEADATVTETAAAGAELVAAKDAQGAEVMIPQAIVDEWEKYGGEAGHLGAITNVDNKNDEDYVVSFASNSYIVYTPEHGAVMIKGKIAETWFNDGGMENPIGLPEAAEQELTDGTGWTQKFQEGTIDWTQDDNGAFSAKVK